MSLVVPCLQVPCPYHETACLVCVVFASKYGLCLTSMKSFSKEVCCQLVLFCCLGKLVVFMFFLVLLQLWVWLIFYSFSYGWKAFSSLWGLVMWDCWAWSPFLLPNAKWHLWEMHAAWIRNMGTGHCGSFGWPRCRWLRLDADWTKECALNLLSWVVGICMLHYRLSEMKLASYP